MIAFDLREKDRELRWFGQELFLRAEAKGGLDSKEYLEALANNHRYARAEGIDRALGAIAAAFERASNARRAPTYAKSLDTPG